jgi:allantoin racemase
MGGVSMRIWCQSCGAFGKDPIWDDYERGLKERAEEVVRTGTVVELHGLEASVPGIDRYRVSQNLCTVQAVKNAIRAEEEGYDAFVMISTIDAGFLEVREAANIPVVFMLENSVHFAMLLAPRFAFFTHNEGLLTQLTEQTRQYGLGKAMVTGSHMDLSYMDWPDMFGHPEKYLDPITQKVKEAIANGARILIPAALPLGVWLTKQGLLEIDGARVLDAFGCAVKMAELMVELKKIGITRANYGPPQKSMLETIRSLYVS